MNDVHTRLYMHGDYIETI